jgi:rRNA maturation protein Nop10
VPLHRNARDADRAPIDGLIGTRYTLEVCVVCGHERVHTPRQDTSCPECGATARRSFPLVRDLREVQR